MSHSTTTRRFTTLAAKTMMTSQMESFSKNVSKVDFALPSSVDACSKDQVRRHLMVPPEAPLPMRRQPTPLLIGPFRWSVWSILTQVFTDLVRRSRYSLGYERD